MSNDPIINNSDQQDLDLQPSDVQLENNQEGMGAGYQSSNKRIAKNTLALFAHDCCDVGDSLYESSCSCCAWS